MLLLWKYMNRIRKVCFRRLLVVRDFDRDKIPSIVLKNHSCMSQGVEKVTSAGLSWLEALIPQQIFFYLAYTLLRFKVLFQFPS